MSTKLKGVGEFPDNELHHNHQTNEVDTNE